MGNLRESLVENIEIKSECYEYNVNNFSFVLQHRPSMLKAKLSKVRFWKRGGDAGEKYEVSMQPEGDSVA